MIVSVVPTTDTREIEIQVQEEIAHPTVLCEAKNIEDCEPVKKFDVNKLYKDSPEVKSE